MEISQHLLSDLKARFLAKLHRRRFNRACVAHPWDAQAQLVGDSFRGCRVKLQRWRVEELMDWMMDEVKKWGLKIKMLDLVKSEICWSERNRYLSKKRRFCAARQMSWWPVVLPWGLEPTLAWWRRSDFFHPTFHLLDVLRSSCGITILKTKWGAPPVLSDYCLVILFWLTLSKMPWITAIQGADLGLLKNHAWRCACLWAPLPCTHAKNPWNNWCNKKNIHTFV